MKGRVFLIVMDSVGIGGAPDADQYFNDGVPDTGANTALISRRPVRWAKPISTGRVH